MLLLLWSMIVRPLGFEYRSKLPSAGWRNVWDWALFLSGFLPMVIYGAAIGNMFSGVPFHFSWNMTSYYTGSFITLFNPFAVLAGLLSLSLSIFMGGAMLMGRGEGALHQRARGAVVVGGIVAAVLFTVCGIWVANMQGFQLVSGPDPAIAQTPLQQTVTLAGGAWLGNFHNHPILWLVPALGYVGMLLGALAARAGKATLAWWLGALAWIGVLGTAGTALFPFMMPSSSDPSQSLTAWNSGSSQLTLAWMTGWAAVFVPLILWYTSWAFYIMRGKVKGSAVEADDHAY